MIFTGVTGGEIISLLYPLFILSPFCYIIISKESLDGTTHQRTRNGNVFVTQEAFIWQWMGRISFTECDPSVWDADRKQCVRNARCLHVCAGSRSADSGEKL